MIRSLCKKQSFDIKNKSNIKINHNMGTKKVILEFRNKDYQLVEAHYVLYLIDKNNIEIKLYGSRFDEKKKEYNRIRFTGTVSVIS